MAGKKASDYRHNAALSMKSLGADLYSSYTPNTKAAISDIRSGYKEVANSRTNVGFNTVKNKIKTYPLFKFVNDMTKSAFDGLRTGKFYQSEDELLGFDDSAFNIPDIDDNFFFDDSGDTDDYMQARQGDETEATSSSTTGKLVEGLAKTSVSTTNASQRAMTEGFYQTATAINNTLISVSTDLKAQMIKTEASINNLGTKIDEQTKIQADHLKISTETLAEIKQMREMTGDYMIPRINNKEESNTRGVTEWYDLMKKGDLLGGGKSALKTAGRAIDNTKTQGVFGMMQGMLPMIMMMSGGNAFNLAKMFLLEPFLDKQFGLSDFTQKWEKRFKSIPDTFDSMARTASLSDNATIRAVGESLRNKKETNTTISSNKYDKSNRVFFDGMTREAIVNVIPTYLSSIVSLLSGKERTTYDYEKGKFSTLSKTKSTFHEAMPKLNNDGDRLATMIESILSEDEKKGMDPNRLRKVTKVMMDKLAENSYTITNFKDHSYNKALNTMALTEDEMSESDFLKLRSMMAKLETDKRTSEGFFGLNRNMENYVNSRNEFMKTQSENARRSGLIATTNNSHLLDSGASIGFGGRRGSGSQTTGHEYQDLMHNYGITNIGSVERDGNLFGTTLTQNEIDTINEYNRRELGGFGAFKGALNQNTKILLQSKMIEKLGVANEQWYKDMVGTSHYDIQDIIGNQKFLDDLIASAVEEEAIKTKLSDMGLEEAGQDEVLNIITDPSMSEEKRYAELKRAISGTSLIKSLSFKLSDKAKKTTDVVEAIKSGDYSSIDNAKEKFDASTGITLSGYARDMRAHTETAKQVLTEATSSAKEKGSSFYKDNKDTIMNVAKASLGAGAGFMFLKSLGSTGIGSIASSFGLFSPIALGAGALGAGIYAYKNNVFENLFGDSDKLQATKKKTASILKTSLFGAGLAGGASALLSLLPGMGMMGPVSIALSGLALGIAGENKGFKKMLFGTEEGSFMSNMKIWMIGDDNNEGILTKATKGISSYFKSGFGKMDRWFKKDIWEPLSDTFKPINTFINTTANKLFTSITGIPATLENSLFKNMKTNLTDPLMKKLDEGLLQPMSGFLKKTLGGVFSFFGKMISTPVKLFRTLITGETESSKFSGSFGSTGTVTTTTDYKDNMKDKRKLYEDTKYMSMEEANSTLSKKDLKQFRKFRADEAMKARKNIEDNEEDTADEVGKGISKGNFYKQSAMGRMTSGFNGKFAGCGISCLATAISEQQKQKITPDELISKKFGWDASMLNGITPAYMMNVLKATGTPAMEVGNINVPTIERELKKGALFIAEIFDFETDDLHFILVHDFDDENFIYSDPERGPNEKVAKSLLVAKLRRGILVYKALKQNASMIGGIMNSPKMNYFKSNASEAMGFGGDVDYVGNEYSSGSSAGSVSVSGGGIRAKIDKASRNRELKEQPMYKLVKGFRDDMMSTLETISDNLLVQTQGVAYNLEYIKRSLANKFGEVDDFDASGINNKTFSRAKMWFKGKYRSAKRVLGKAKDFIYDNTIGRVKGVVDAVNSVIMNVAKIPQTIGRAIKDTLVAILPSKKFFQNMWAGLKELTSSAYSGLKTMISDGLSAIGNGIKFIGRGILNGINAIGRGIMSTVDKMGKVIDWTADTLGKAGNWLFNRLGQLANWGYEKVSQGFGWITGKAKDALGMTKEMLKPKEVYVTGGVLNSVQRVEIVKAVGAVDLDYAESLDRKLGKAGNKIKSPKFKVGQEYAKIDKRQDEEAQIIHQTVESNKDGEEKKGGLLETLLGGKFASTLTTAFTAAAGGLVPAILMALGANGFSNSELGEKYSEFVTNQGYDGTEASQRFTDVAGRKVDKLLVKGGIAVAKKVPAVQTGVKTVAKKAVDLAKNIDIKKGVTVLIDFLTKFFTNPKVVAVLGEKVSKGMLRAIPALAKKAGQVGSKALAKAGIRMAAYSAPPVGLAVDIGFAIWDFTSGSTWGADDLFGVRQRDLSLKQRTVAGIVKCLQGFIASKGPLILLALIPVDWLVQTVWKFVADEEEYNEWTGEKEQKKKIDVEKVKEETAKAETSKDKKMLGGARLPQNSYKDGGKMSTGNVPNVTSSNMYNFTSNKVANANANVIADMVFRIAEEAGVDPYQAMAQWAQESGWGRHRSKAAIEANALFGIKAGKGWNGKTVDITTREVVTNSQYMKEFKPKGFKVVGTKNGKLEILGNDKFRAYNSVEDAVRDYVNFIKLRGYDKNLSGYATDPNYLKSINTLKNQFAKGRAGVKVSQGANLDDTSPLLRQQTDGTYSSNVTTASNMQVTSNDITPRIAENAKNTMVANAKAPTVQGTNTNSNNAKQDIKIDMPEGTDNESLRTMVGQLMEVNKNLLSLIKLSGINLEQISHNGLALNTSVGGRPVPVTASTNTSSDDFLRKVISISKG